MTVNTVARTRAAESINDRERLFLALAALAEASSVHLRAVDALNTARDHIESVLTHSAGAAQGAAA